MASPPRPASLCVAALQLNSARDDVAGNLSRALPHVEAAAAAGAHLVLLPELYPSGYVFERALWRTAERLEDGPTRAWCCAHAARLGVHLGTSFVEARASMRARGARPQRLTQPSLRVSQARGQHFLNTFILAAPDGSLAGVVRKQTPAALEAFLFAPGVPRGPGSHVFPCPLLGGLRVGVFICYESHLLYALRYAAAEDADLLLLPHCATQLEGLPAAVCASYDSVLMHLPRRTAAALGVPVVMANKSGPFRSSFLGSELMVFQAPFPGYSSIVDADGSVLAPPTSDENVRLQATVRIPPPGTARRALQRGGSLGPPSMWDEWRKFGPQAPHPITLRVLFAIDEALGGAVYRLSGARRAAALAASRMPADAASIPPWRAQLHPAMLAVAALAAARLVVALRRE